MLPVPGARARGACARVLRALRRLTRSPDGVLVWDFDGTLAHRPGNWTGVICEVVAAAHPDLELTVERLRPYLQAGFPWHAPDVVRDPCSADEWWNDLLPVLADALRRASGIGDVEARRLIGGVRSAYTDAAGWQLFLDVRPALERLRGRGWTHVVLSNHVPELASLIGALGLGDLIKAVHCSACTGVEKPNPRAFERMFSEYPAARNGWMIGDSWRADVQGAQAVGMRAILVRSQHPAAPIRCETLHDVAVMVDTP